VTKTDAQALIASLVALDVAAIAAFLVFYGQAVSRFGPKLAAQLWRSIWFLFPTAVLIALTTAGLYAWGKAPVKGELGEGWYAPVAVGAQLAASALSTIYLIRWCLPGRYRAAMSDRFGLAISPASMRRTPSWCSWNPSTSEAA
jgi:hypothetical protein